MIKGSPSWNDPKITLLVVLEANAISVSGSDFLSFLAGGPFEEAATMSPRWWIIHWKWPKSS